MKKIAAMVMGVTLVAGHAFGVLIWQEDFADVSDWSIIANPSNDASIVSDGSHGLFTEPSPGLLWPAGAAFGPTNRIPFNPATPEDYHFGFTVTAISNSMSFDIALDCFSNSVYVATVWDIFPNQAYTGSTNIHLAPFSFNPTIDTISPKLTIHTGDGDQTITFDEMNMDQIPEPATIALLVAAAAVLGLRRKR